MKIQNKFKNKNKDLITLLQYYLFELLENDEKLCLKLIDNILLDHF